MRKYTVTQLLDAAHANSPRGISGGIRWLLEHKLADGRSKEIVLKRLRAKLAELEDVLRQLKEGKADELVHEWERYVQAYKEIIRRGEKARVTLSPEDVRKKLGI